MLGDRRDVTAADDDFSGYVSARWATLVRTAIYLGSDPPDAEDLVQTALMRCYQVWSRVAKADEVDAYVYRVLVNTRAKARQRRWRGELASDAVPENGKAFSQASDARADLTKVLADLSRDHREVLVLRFVTDLSERDTAEVLGVPVGTVKSRVARALAQIDPARLQEESA